MAALLSVTRPCTFSHILRIAIGTQRATSTRCSPAHFSFILHFLFFLNVSSFLALSLSLSLSFSLFLFFHVSYVCVCVCVCMSVCLFLLFCYVCLPLGWQMGCQLLLSCSIVIFQPAIILYLAMQMSKRSSTMFLLLPFPSFPPFLPPSFFHSLFLLFLLLLLLIPTAVAVAN